MGLNKLETFVSTITTNQQHLLHGEGKRPCKVAILIYVILVKTKLLEILSMCQTPSYHTMHLRFQETHYLMWEMDKHDK